MSILDQAAPAAETVESINVLIYGNPGAGKTVFSGSGRDSGRNDLIIAIDHGTVSAARAGSLTQTIKVKDWATVLEIVEAIEDEPDRYEWVIVDGLTKLQDVIWDHIVSTEVRRNPSRSKYVKQLQEYGEAQGMLMEVVERLVSSEANILFTAHAELATDEDSQEFRRPQIHGRKGALSEWVCAQVDLLGYLRLADKDGTEYRRLEFNQQPEFVAKDRFNVFVAPQANLTLDTMTSRLLESGVQAEAVQDEEDNDKDSK